MAKATPGTEAKVPKKRATKAKPAPENGAEVVEAAATSAVAKEAKKETKSPVSLEEKVRARAYELFLQRGGRGGSPEQDWLQAVSEIHSQSVA
jgi:hypothetical protein